MDDELFMADSSPSKPEESLSSIPHNQSFTNLFYCPNSKTRVVAYCMLRSLLKRVAYKHSAYIKFRKCKVFLRWRYSASIASVYPLTEQKLNSMFSNFVAAVKSNLKRFLFIWARKVRNPIHNLQSRHEYNKNRREEAHSSQLAQMNKALTQILNKQSELEKAITMIAAKEKGYKEAIEELNRPPQNDTIDLSRHEALLRELEGENQNLRDKLEAVENNVSGFIKEMSELLENDEDNSLPSDDDGLGDSQGRSTRKKRMNALR